MKNPQSARAIRFRIALPLVLLLTPLLVTAQSTYKCEEGGKTVYRDQPCSGAQGTVGEDVARRKQAQVGEATTSGRKKLPTVEGADSAEEAVTAKACGPKRYADPGVGMTAAWVQRCSSWRLPDSVNTTKTARGTVSQWVYDQRGYVYLNELDIVTAVQTIGR